MNSENCKNKTEIKFNVLINKPKGTKMMFMDMLTLCLKDEKENNVIKFPNVFFFCRLLFCEKCSATEFNTVDQFKCCFSPKLLANSDMVLLSQKGP